MSEIKDTSNEDKIFYRCGQCFGLFETSLDLAGHKDSCDGDPRHSTCQYIAVEKAKILKNIIKLTKPYYGKKRGRPRKSEQTIQETKEADNDHIAQQSAPPSEPQEVKKYGLRRNAVAAMKERLFNSTDENDEGEDKNALDVKIDFGVGDDDAGNDNDDEYFAPLKGETLDNDNEDVKEPLIKKRRRDVLRDINKKPIESNRERQQRYRDILKSFKEKYKDYPIFKVVYARDIPGMKIKAAVGKSLGNKGINSSQRRMRGRPKLKFDPSDDVTQENNKDDESPRDDVTQENNEDDESPRDDVTQGNNKEDEPPRDDVTQENNEYDESPRDDVTQENNKKEDESQRDDIIQSEDDKGIENIEKDEVNAKNEGNSKMEISIDVDSIISFKPPKLKTPVNPNQAFYGCNLCGFSSQYVGMFVKHLLTHNDGGEFMCNICDFKCLFARDYKLHMSRHEHPFQCHYCRYRANAKRDLEKHLLRHTGVHPIKCKLCPYSCRQTKCLKEHMRKHTGEFLRCDFRDCSYKTCYAQCLVVHKMRHDPNVKKYTCETCGYQTFVRGSFSKHVKGHLGLRDHKCPYCDYSSVTKTDIKRHLRVHTRDSAYFCDECPYSTIHYSSLKVHMMSHDGYKPWQCALCDFASTQKSKVERHYLQKHPEKNDMLILFNGDMYDKIKSRLIMRKTTKKTGIGSDPVKQVLRLNYSTQETDQVDINDIKDTNATSVQEVFVDGITTEDFVETLQCPEPNCRYSCRSSASMMLHKITCHSQNIVHVVSQSGYNIEEEVQQETPIQDNAISVPLSVEQIKQITELVKSNNAEDEVDIYVETDGDELAIIQSLGPELGYVLKNDTLEVHQAAATIAENYQESDVTFETTVDETNKEIQIRTNID